MSPETLTGKPSPPPPAMADDIPLFTVIKSGTVFKNLFLNVIPPPAVAGAADREPAASDETTLVVGRHPDCQIVLDHPSISRYHLEIRLRLSVKKLAVVDLSSLHGTYVCGERIEPMVPVEMAEGDEMRLGASSRVYKLQWVSASEAYKIEYPSKNLNSFDREKRLLDPVEDSTPLLDENNHSESKIQNSSHCSMIDSSKESSFSAIKMVMNLEKGTGEEEEGSEKCCETGLQMEQVSQGDNEWMSCFLSRIDASLMEFEDASPVKQAFSFYYSPQSSETQMSQEQSQNLINCNGEMQKLDQFEDFTPMVDEVNHYVSEVQNSSQRLMPDSSKESSSSAIKYFMNLETTAREDGVGKCNEIGFQVEKMSQGNNECVDCFLNPIDVSLMELNDASQMRKAFSFDSSPQSLETQISQVQSRSSIDCDGEMQKLNQIENLTPMLDADNHYETGIQDSSQCSMLKSPKEPRFSLIKMVMYLEKTAGEEEDAEKCYDSGLQMEKEGVLGDILVPKAANSPNKEPLEVSQGNNEWMDCFLSQIDVSPQNKIPSSIQKFSSENSPQSSETLMSEQAIFVEEVCKKLEAATMLDSVDNEQVVEQKLSPSSNILQQREYVEVKSVSPFLPESNSEKLQSSIDFKEEKQQLNQVDNSTALLDENNHSETRIKNSLQCSTPDCLKESSFPAIKTVTNLENNRREEGHADACTTYLNESVTSSPALIISSETGLQLENKVRDGVVLVSDEAKSPVAIGFMEGNEFIGSFLSQHDVSFIELKDPSTCKGPFYFDNSSLSSETLTSQQATTLEEVLKEVETPSKIAPANIEERYAEKLTPTGSTVEQREVAEAESVSSSVPALFLSGSNSEQENMGTNASKSVVRHPLTEREQINLGSLELRDSSSAQTHKYASHMSVASGRSGENSSGGIFTGSEKENDENIRASGSLKEVEESLCKVLFSGQVKEEGVFVSNQENLTSITTSLNSKLEQKVNCENLDFSNSPASSAMVSSDLPDDFFPSDKENMTPSISRSCKALLRTGDNKIQISLDRDTARRPERVPFQSITVNSKCQSRTCSFANATGKVTDSVSCTQSKVDEHREDVDAKKGGYRKKWNMVVDTCCLLDEESIKSLKLLEGLGGTHLIIPRMVIRELDCQKRKASWFRKDDNASSTLQWIEDCMVKESRWIHVQNSTEIAPIPPTPPACSPHSCLSDGSQGAARSAMSFSKYGDFLEIASPTAGDHILECALLFKKLKTDEQIVLLTNDITLTIKAMSEGLICETAKDFRESLVNPFSKRFLWADSSPRGQTWCAFDEAQAIQQKYGHQFPTARTTPNAGNIAKGLKLILLHNSKYGHVAAVP